jgi:predicted nucleotidyltransferase
MADMLPKNTQKEIVRRIRKVADPVSIVLFGSYAYGTPTPESDLDIAVICRRMVSRTRQCIDIRRALSGIKGSIDVLVTTPEEYSASRKDAGSVYRTISEKGVVLYG